LYLIVIIAQSDKLNEEVSIDPN